MIKKLTAIGNSLGLIIERPILDILEIDKDTPLEIRTDGDSLIIKPQRTQRAARVRLATKRMIAAHSETLKKLAR